MLDRCKQISEESVKVFSFIPSDWVLWSNFVAFYFNPLLLLHLALTLLWLRDKHTFYHLVKSDLNNTLFPLAALIWFLIIVPINIIKLISHLLKINELALDELSVVHVVIRIKWLFIGVPNSDSSHTISNDPSLTEVIGAGNICNSGLFSQW